MKQFMFVMSMRFDEINKYEANESKWCELLWFDFDVILEHSMA